MKKLHKLILKSFIGPFILTFLVVVFILLLVYMMKYFDDLVGKDLSFAVLSELMISFSIVMTPNAFPLAILLSSLMTYGNLGEHFELTAIKSAGISLTRALQPLFYFSIALTFVAYLSNNYVVPRAALNAYSLMYDIRKHKPALDIKEGSFYNGIQNFSIKIDKKLPDGETMQGLIIYDHSKHNGNIDVIMADSGRIYPFMEGRYLVMELFNGHRFTQEKNIGKTSYKKREVPPYSRTSFDHTKMVFDLSDFKLDLTDKKLFASNRMMKTLGKLSHDIDSMDVEKSRMEIKVFDSFKDFYTYHLKEKVVMPTALGILKKELDSLQKIEIEERSIGDSLMMDERRKADAKELKAKKDSADIINKKAISSDVNVLVDKKKVVLKDSLLTAKFEKKKKESLRKQAQERAKREAKERERNKKKKAKPKIVKKIKKKRILTLEETLAVVDSTMNLNKNKLKVVSSALTKGRHIKNSITSNVSTYSYLSEEVIRHKIEKHKKFSLSLVCLIMFSIGAPLGAIIKKGGLGVPVIISVFFFIIFYVINITSDKMARQGLIDPILGAWAASIILLPFGLFFLRQARVDAKLFDLDYYNVAFAKLKGFFVKKK